MENLLCPHCDTELTEDAKFCPICGADVTEYIRQVKKEQQNQQKTLKNEVPIEENNEFPDGDIDGKKTMLKRFLTAFGFTLVASIIGIVALLVGGLV